MAKSNKQQKKPAPKKASPKKRLSKKVAELNLVDLDLAIESSSGGRKGGATPGWEAWPENVLSVLSRIILRNDDPEDAVYVSAEGAALLLRQHMDFTVSANTLHRYAKMKLNRERWSTP